jgi:hypothetical protein
VFGNTQLLNLAQFFDYVDEEATDVGSKSGFEMGFGVLGLEGEEGESDGFENGVELEVGFWRDIGGMKKLRLLGFWRLK